MCKIRRIVICGSINIDVGPLSDDLPRYSSILDQSKLSETDYRDKTVPNRLQDMTSIATCVVPPLHGEKKGAGLFLRYVAITYTSGRVSRSEDAIMRTSAEQCRTGVIAKRGLEVGSWILGRVRRGDGQVEKKEGEGRRGTR